MAIPEKHAQISKTTLHCFGAMILCRLSKELDMTQEMCFCSMNCVHRQNPFISQKSSQTKALHLIKQ